MDFTIEKDLYRDNYIPEETEVYYVIAGRLKTRRGSRPISLGPEGVVLLNSGSEGFISCEKGTLLGKAVFSDRDIVRVSDNENFLFDCCSQDDMDHSYEALRGIFRELTVQSLKKETFGDCMKRSLLYRLLYRLMKDFYVPFPDYDRGSGDDRRLSYILRYVHRNYSRDIRLFELAGQMYLSPSSVSRFFKKHTGLYFADYLKQLRVKKAAERMLKTGDSITRIALDCGFASPSAFNHCFRELYGMAPGTWRQEKSRELPCDDAKDGAAHDKKEGAQAGKEAEQAQEAVLKDLYDRLCASGGSLKKERILVDIAGTRPVPVKKLCNEILNIGAINNLTRVDIQQHTLVLKERLGIRYVRLWNIFSGKLELTDGVHTGVYNYDQLDGVLDFLVSHDLIPFLELGKRETVAMEKVRTMVYRTQDYIDFASREVWEAMVTDFFDHVIRRYGGAQVACWRFEAARSAIDTVECRCYEDPAYDYFNVYRHIWKTAKARLPQAVVGGPMGICRYDTRFLGDFLKRCREEGCLPDFVSWALFSYEQDSRGHMIRRSMSPPGVCEADTAKEIRAVMGRYLPGDRPLYITEWNFSLSSRNYLNDSCYRAVYLAWVAAALSGLADVLAVWVASDWISSYYDTISIANGGNGILTKNRIPKPVCHAMEFFRRMGNQQLYSGEHGTVTLGDNGDLYILCHSFVTERYRTETEEETENAQTILRAFRDGPVREIGILLSGLDSGSPYMVKTRRFNETEGSLLGLWERFGYENHLSAEDIDYIRESCRPALSIARQKAKDGRLELKLELKPFEMALVHVFPV